VFEKVKKLIQDNPEAAAVAGCCGLCYVMGIYTGMHMIDPVKLLDKGPDLWIRIAKESFSKFDEGKSLVCLGTPVGDLMVSRFPSEAAVKALAVANGKV
jgi:hypothetical protein